MRFAFTDDQLAFQAGVRDLFDNGCTSEDVRLAWSDGWSPARWKQLAEMGVAGLTVPEGHGGLGMDELDLVLLLEESGRAALPEPLIETTAVAAPLLAEIGGSVADTWLPRIASGDATVTVALAGQQLVAHADRANLTLAFAPDLSLHALPREAVVVTPQDAVDRARPVATIAWTPSSDTLIASTDEAGQALLRAADRGALACAAQLLGAGRQVIAMATSYALQREQFGRPIGSFQAVKHHLASALVEVEFCRPVVYNAAHSLARGVGNPTVDVSVAKVMTAEAAQLAAKAAIQVHGAIGYTWEHDLHLWMKRIWSLAAAWGTTSQHRDRIADSLGIA